VKSFDTGVSELQRLIGNGKLTGEVTFDTPYAAVQHERMDFSHPGGGEAKYLETPLKQKHRQYLAAIAGDLLGIGPERAMRMAVEDLLGEAARRAPVDEGTLRASGHARVY
jgi:hypothetical protein